MTEQDLSPDEQRERLAKLSLLVPRSEGIGSAVEGCDVRPVVRTNPFGAKIRFLRITPTSKRPGLEAFRVGWGGGREYGGGISRDARRRARRQERRRSKVNRS